MGRILECHVGGGWQWQWQWQMAIAGKHGKIRLSRLLLPSTGARTRRVGCFFVAHKREQILNGKKTEKKEAAHAETDGASDSNRSSKSYFPVTMAVAAADGVIIALPWALL